MKNCSPSPARVYRTLHNKCVLFFPLPGTTHAISYIRTPYPRPPRPTPICFSRDAVLYNIRQGEILAANSIREKLLGRDGPTYLPVYVRPKVYFSAAHQYVLKS